MGRQPLKIFVGFDGEVEPVAYHVFCQSVIERSSIPVSFTPLSLNNIKEYVEVHDDGSNAFIYSRFLVPYLCDFKGYALYVDGDMLCREDIDKIIDDIDPWAAVSVVKHDYKTKFPVKYCGNKNEDYPKKNWSSLMFWDCGHHKNKRLTPEFIMEHGGAYLHRFEWLKNDFIDLVGKLPIEWNWLVSEYDFNSNAKLVHYTIGTPCFKNYRICDYSNEWHDTLERAIKPLCPIDIVGNQRIKDNIKQPT